MTNGKTANQTPQVDDTVEVEEKKRGTVSLRNMDLSLWYKMGYKAKMEGITMTQYTERLIEQDLSN